MIVEGIGIIEGGPFGVLRPAAEAEMAFRGKLRAFRGQIHHPARHALTVQRRRGAPDDVNPFNKPGIDLQDVVAAAVAHQAHAVEKQVINITAVVAA